MSARAARTLQLSIPGTAPEDPAAEVLVAAVTRLGGIPSAMLMRTAEWVAESSRYLTAPIDESVPAGLSRADLVARAVADQNVDLLLPGLVGTMDVVALEVLPGGQTRAAAAASVSSWVADEVEDGEGVSKIQAKALIRSQDSDLAFIDFRYVPVDAAITLTTSLGPGFAYDPELYGPVGEGTLPALAGTVVQLRVVDPDTGYTHWEAGYSVGDGGVIGLEPDESPGSFGEQLMVVGGSPFTVYSFRAAETSDQGFTLDDGIVVYFENSVLAVTLEPNEGGPVAEGMRATLTRLTAGAQGSARGRVIGSANLAVSDTEVGDPMLLVLEGTLSIESPLRVQFNQMVEARIDEGKISVSNVSGSGLPELDVDARADHLFVRNGGGWHTDSDYDLRLEQGFLNDSGVDEEEALPAVVLPFRTREVGHANAVSFDEELVTDSIVEGAVALLATRERGLRAYDIQDPSDPKALGFWQAAWPLTSVVSDPFGHVFTAQGMVQHPVSVHLLKLEDLLGTDAAAPVAELAVVQQAGSAGDGKLTYEVLEQTRAFSGENPPDEVSVQLGADGFIEEMVIDASLLHEHSPVRLYDNATGALLWEGTASGGDLTVDPPAQLASDATLLLRAHHETFVYVSTLHGPMVALRLVKSGAGDYDLEAVAGIQNSDLVQAISDDQSNAEMQPCSELNSPDRVSIFDLEFLAGPGGRGVLLGSTDRVGLLGFIQPADSQEVRLDLQPSWVSCLRSANGHDLRDVEAAHWPADDGTQVPIAVAVGNRTLYIQGIDATGHLSGNLATEDLEWQPFRVALDPDHETILVRNAAGDLTIFSFSLADGSLEAESASLEVAGRVTIPEGQGPLRLLPDYGVAMVGTVAVQYRQPTVQVFVDRDRDGIPEKVEYLQPLGAPEPVVEEGARPGYLAYLVVRTVGVPADRDSLEVLVEGVSERGGVAPNRPEPFLPSSARLRLARVTGGECQGQSCSIVSSLANPGKFVFRSTRPLLLIADERARSDYWQSLTESERQALLEEDEENGVFAVCRNCDRGFPDLQDFEIPFGVVASHEDPVDTSNPEDGPIELASSGVIRFRIASDQGTDWLDEAVDESLLGTEVASVRWMPSAGLHSEPGIWSAGDWAPEVDLASGALQLEDELLSLPAPGLDVSASRVFRSQGVRWGLFGWGWELAELSRLRVCPDGTVELWSPDGDRFVFSDSGPAATASTLTSWGTPLELKQKRDGSFFLLSGDGAYVEFSLGGDPIVARDRWRRDDESGSELRFVWGTSGKLLGLVQENGTGSAETHQRAVWFRYDEEDGLSADSELGVITSVQDSTGRSVNLQYDNAGRLVQTEWPEVRLDAKNSLRKGRPAEQLTYEGVQGTDEIDVRFLKGQKLLSVSERGDSNAIDRRTLDVAYESSASGQVREVCHGEICTDISIPAATASPRTATLTDASLRVRAYSLDDLGRVTKIKRVGEAESTDIVYVASSRDPLVAQEVLPNGLTLEYGWDSGQYTRRRMNWNVQTVTETADQEVRQSAYQYHGETNLVASVDAPEDRSWTITRTGEGGPAPTVKIKDPEDRVVELTLDRLGRVVEEKRYQKYTTTFEYDDEGPSAEGTGELHKITPPTPGNLHGTGSPHTVIEYSPDGYPIRTEEPGADGSTARVVRRGEFNALGWPLREWTEGVTDTRAYYAYDLAGRLERLEVGTANAQRLSTTWEYSRAGLVTKETDQGFDGSIGSASRVTDYFYAPPGGSAESTDGLLRRVVSDLVEIDGQSRRAETELTYHPARRLVTERRVKSGEETWLTTTYGYGEPIDAPTTMTPPPRDGDSHPISYTYDGFGRARTVTDPLGRVLTRTYDLADRMTALEVLAADGDRLMRREMEYDDLDQVTRVTLKSDDGGDTNDRVTSYGYDETTRLLLHTDDAEGRRTTYHYDDASGMLESTELPDGTRLGVTYWPNGLPAAQTEVAPDGSGGATYTTETRYDRLGRPKAITFPGGATQSIEYDALGRRARVQENIPLFGTRTSTWTYGPLGNEVTADLAGESAQVTLSDFNGQVIEVKQTLGNSHVVVFSASYDLAGRKVSESTAGSDRTYDWTDDGLLRQVAYGSAGEDVINYRYDGAGRLLKRFHGAALEQRADPACELGEPCHELEYDGLDRVTRATNHENGVVVEREYSFAGEVLEETLTIPRAATVDPMVFTTRAKYDRTGMLTQLTYPGLLGSPTVVDYERAEPLGRLSSVKVTSPAGEVTTRWRADYAGLRASGGEAPGVSIQHGYHGTGVRSSSVYFADDTKSGEPHSVRSRFERTLTGLGTFTDQTVHSALGLTYGLRHDGALRLAGVGLSRDALIPFDSTPGMSSDEEAHPPYDRELERADPSVGEEAPDLIARIKVVDGPSNQAVGYSHGEAFRSDTMTLKYSFLPGQPDLTWSYLYGDRGEVSARALAGTDRNNRFQHNWADRLTAIQWSDELSEQRSIEDMARFDYDAFGRRVRSTVNQVTTYRVPWGDQVIAEYVQEGATTRLDKRLYWADGVDRLLGYDWDGADLDGVLQAQLSAVTDTQGTVHAILDSDGKPVESYVYHDDGRFEIYGEDISPPRLTAVLMNGSTDESDRFFVAVFSEPVQPPAGTGVTISDAEGEQVPLSAPVEAYGGRVWYVPVSDDGLFIEDDAYTVAFGPYEDRSGNTLELPPEHPFGFRAPDLEAATKVVIYNEGDNARQIGGGQPQVLQVIDAPLGLSILVDRPVDGASLQPDSVLVLRDGQEIPGTVRVINGRDLGPDGSSPYGPPPFGFMLYWEPENPIEYLPDSEQPLLYDVQINLGTSRRSVEDVVVNHLGEGHSAWLKASDAPRLAVTAVGNDRYLHSRPFIKVYRNGQGEAQAELYDHRARWYNPLTRNFLQPDPLGPVDSTNLYQAFNFDPFNVTDPAGLSTWDSFKDYYADYRAREKAKLRASIQEVLEGDAMEQAAVTFAGRPVNFAVGWWKTMGGAVYGGGVLLHDVVAGGLAPGYAMRSGSYERQAAVGNAIGGFLTDPFGTTGRHISGRWNYMLARERAGDWAGSSQVLGSMALEGYAAFQGGAALTRLGRSAASGVAQLRRASRKSLSQAERLTATMRKDVGYNITPESTFEKYSHVGRHGTFVTDYRAVGSVLGPVRANQRFTVGLFTRMGRNQISFFRAWRLERALGLTRGSLREGFRFTRISKIARRNPRPPTATEGNLFFQGIGKGLPGGGPELLIDPIPTSPWP